MTTYIRYSALPLLPLAFAAVLLRNKLQSSRERVVILGASGGIGRALALKYACRGARVCIVARREHELAVVAEECLTEFRRAGLEANENPVLCFTGDFTVVEDMVKLRTQVETEWNGLDTLVVCAGVATFLPFCELTGLEAHGRTFTPSQADGAMIQHAIEIVNAATRTNYVGPAIAAATFVAVAPSVVLISSLAANPFITFTCVLPSTVRGETFFQSAVDGGKVRGVDPNTYGLSQDAVVERCLEAVDKGEEMVYLPWSGRIVHILSLFWPSVIASIGRKRYGYPVE
ncbi:hypothetical protein C8Q76DRAFT_769651 [Earliella scabrosa]|nr:hypothetical protein C8Q76DRAFT_769651 [Earliella scabrosa]